MRIDRVTHPAVIRSIAIHPKIFPWITDDQSVSRADWQPPMSEGLIWLVASNVQIGNFGWGGFFPRNGITLETHFAFLPQAWGFQAEQAFAEMIRWVRVNSKFQRLIGEIPRSNRLAVRFAKRAGFKAYGVNEKSIWRQGQLEDQICFGLNLSR